jgi:phosphoglycolate phosphatase (TIGR01487 family)
MVDPSNHHDCRSEGNVMNFEDTVSLTESFTETLPPLSVDIDGTLTDDTRHLDPRVIPILRGWPSTLVIATGKAMPYPVGLCEFLGLEPYVIAENGGVVLIGRQSVEYVGDRKAATAVVEQYLAEGYSLGWGEADLVNRWRETEIAVSRDSPLEPLESIANPLGLEVVDTGYAYHVKSPDLSKGDGLHRLTNALEVTPGEFVAVGDSVNDVSTFDAVDTGIAVANADDAARKAADHVTEASYGSGFLEAVQWVADKYGD